MQHCFVVIFQKHNLHLLHDEALQQNVWDTGPCCVKGSKWEYHRVNRFGHDGKGSIFYTSWHCEWTKLDEDEIKRSEQYDYYIARNYSLMEIYKAECLKHPKNFAAQTYAGNGTYYHFSSECKTCVDEMTLLTLACVAEMILVLVELRTLIRIRHRNRVQTVNEAGNAQVLQEAAVSVSVVAAVVSDSQLQN